MSLAGRATDCWARGYCGSTVYSGIPAEARSLDGMSGAESVLALNRSLMAWPTP